MKKILNFVISLTIVLLLFVIAPGIVGTMESHYTRDAIVIEVNNDVVTVVDTTDNIWEFEGDGYNEGDNLKLKMFTNYTDSNIYDDEIVNVKIVK